MKTTIEITRCGNCIAWDIKEVGKGLCRINPPQTHPIMTANGPGVMALWPSTARDDGCMEGIPKCSENVQ